MVQSRYHDAYRTAKLYNTLVAVVVAATLQNSAPQRLLSLRQRSGEGWGTPQEFTQHARDAH